jgi:hypothetical protein
MTAICHTRESHGWGHPGPQQPGTTDTCPDCGMKRHKAKGRKGTITYSAPARKGK